MRALLKLLAAHLIGDAALLGLGYYWLGVGESDGLRLAWSAILVAAGIGGAAWLQGAALAYFAHPSTARLRDIPAHPAARWLPLVLLGGAIAVLYFALDEWNPASDDRINQTASYLTLTFQTPVRPAAVERVFNAIWWIIEWMALPALLLPIAAGVATRGWSGFAEFPTRARWRMWLAGPLALAAAYWLAWRLIAWTPLSGNFRIEAVSFGLRFATAYLLLVAGSLTAAFATSLGKPVVSQPSTAVSP
jgi:hypothetical protein